MGLGTKDSLGKLLGDIRFWILFFLVIRLFGITDPPIEMGHNWRQAYTNMIARNFLEIQAHPFYPRVDHAGHLTGITGMEFPLLNYMIFGMSMIFGFEHHHGRIINLLVSSIGILYFFKSVRLLFNRDVALYSSLVLLLSIWFAFMRKLMPDTFSMALGFIGIYYLIQYLRQGKNLFVLLYFIFITLGILSKLPALILMSPLVILPFIKEVALRRKWISYITSFISVGIVGLWYFYWIPHLNSVYGFPLFYPKEMGEGLAEISGFIPELLEKFYFSAFHSFVAFAVFLLGIFQLFKSKNSWVKWAFGVVCLVFSIFIIKTGNFFPQHNYYIIPFVPFMAILVGMAIESFPPKWAYLVLIIIGVESIANQQHDFFIRSDKEYVLGLESLCDEYIPKTSRIIINGGNSPMLMYFSHRKGWSVSPSTLKDDFQIRFRKNLGAEYIIIDKHQDMESLTGYPLIYSDAHFDILSSEKD